MIQRNELWKYVPFYDIQFCYVELGQNYEGKRGKMVPMFGCCCVHHTHAQTNPFSFQASVQIYEELGEGFSAIIGGRHMNQINLHIFRIELPRKKFIFYNLSEYKKNSFFTGWTR